MSERISVAMLDELKPRVAVCVVDACQRLKGYHDLDARLEARESRGDHAQQGTAKECSLTLSTTPPSNPSSLLWGRTQSCRTIHDPMAMNLPDETLVQSGWQALEGALVTFHGDA